MIKVSISPILKEKSPNMALATICCDVKNSLFSEDLWREINLFSNLTRTNFTTSSIKSHAVIKATREIYKRTGKDPNRYRPSAEALMRRLVRGIDLYQINTLVDLINLLSLKTGYSIGGFDADFVSGDVIAGIGEEKEKFEGIGRGVLNICGLPVLRDAIGPIGTPTSDEIRTKIRLETTHLYLNINGYLGSDSLKPTVKEAVRLLEKYAFAENLEWDIVE